MGKMTYEELEALADRMSKKINALRDEITRLNLWIVQYHKEMRAEILAERASAKIKQSTVEAELAVQTDCLVHRNNKIARLEAKCAAMENLLHELAGEGLISADRVFAALRGYRKGRE